MSTETAPLHVALSLPPAPYALASGGFLSTLAAVETQIQTMAVTDPQSAQAAADIQARLTKAGNELEKQRKALKQPFIDAGRAIDQAAESPAQRIEAAKGFVKRLLTAYAEAERKKAEEAERVRQAELRRLEAIRLAEEVEAKRKADELAAQAAAAVAASPVEVMEMEEELPPPQKTETEKAIETLRHAPAPVAPRPIGVTFRTTLVPVVEDVNKLPDMFVFRTANTRAIIATFCAGWKEGAPIPECSGVRFEVKKEPVSTGRSAF